MAGEKKPNAQTRSSPVHVLNREDDKNQANYRSSIRLKYVKLGCHYLISNAMYLLTIPLLAAAAANLSMSHVEDILKLCNYHLKYNVLRVIVCTSFMAVLATIYFMSRPRRVYLVDFACYKPDPSLLCSRDMVMEKVSAVISEEGAAFMKKVMDRSGLGDKTYAAALRDFPPKFRFDCARKEAEMIIFGAIDDLFAKTRVKPRDIGILIVNVSAFSPTPSLSSMIVNRYKFRGDVVSCNLGGMGCSAGLISIDLAKRLLQVGSLVCFAATLSNYVWSFTCPKCHRPMALNYSVEMSIHTISQKMCASTCTQESVNAFSHASSTGLFCSSKMGFSQIAAFLQMSGTEFSVLITFNSPSSLK